MHTHRTPLCLHSASTIFPNPMRLPVKTRSAPSSAKRSAVAFPIPLVAPVMIAVLFFNFIKISFLNNLRHPESTSGRCERSDERSLRQSQDRLRGTQSKDSLHGKFKFYITRALRLRCKKKN